MPDYSFVTRWRFDAPIEAVREAIRATIGGGSPPKDGGTPATEDAGGLVRYDWNVRATKTWRRLFAPVARPIFSWDHDAVMGDGERGLRRLLGARR